jgi:hypothetical protein
VPKENATMAPRRRKALAAAKPDWSALGQVLDLVANELRRLDPEVQARARPWWEREGGEKEQIAYRFGLPSFAPCRKDSTDDARAVCTVRTLRMVCRTWRDSLTYATPSVEWLVFPSSFMRNLDEPSIRDVGTFRQLKVLELELTSTLGRTIWTRGAISGTVLGALPEELLLLPELRALKLCAVSITKLPA